MYTVAVDAMGGDYGLKVVIPAVIQVMSIYSDVRFILVGESSLIKDEFLKLRISQKYLSSIDIVHASQNVSMDESPISALKNKKDSSMRVALNLLKEDKALACVSSGNTGALLAMSKFVLGTIKNIDRPAIISAMPTIDGHCYVVDLGANVDCNAKNLMQFAVMGSSLAKYLDNIENPRVALLNIGEEAIKGNEQVKKTAQLLSNNKHINYTGYIEGNDICLGKADVIVCDGFVGNVALKVSEGVVKYILSIIKKSFKNNIFGILVGIFVWPILKKIKKKLDVRQYNGASLIGLKKIVVKSHGSADIQAFKHSIIFAIREIEKDIPQKIAELSKNSLDN